MIDLNKMDENLDELLDNLTPVYVEEFLKKEKGVVMEVLSYLELMLEHSKMSFSEQEVNMMDFSDDLNLGEQTIEEFYAQPFSPELIEKYFEEIECKDGFIPLPIINTYKKKYALEPYWYDGYRKPLFIDFARTLDEFIIDCQRAGIKLKWRKQ